MLKRKRKMSCGRRSKGGLLRLEGGEGVCVRDGGGGGGPVLFREVRRGKGREGRREGGERGEKGFISESCGLK